MPKEFALQLYSVRDSVAEDMRATLKKVAELGFTGVEFAGYGGLSAEEMAEELKKNSLKAVGTHASLPHLLEHIDEEIKYNKVIGNKNIICAWAAVNSEEDAVKVGKQLEELAQKCAAEGMVFGYHNHTHEFVRGEKGLYIDIMFELAPSVVPEFDVAWVTAPGYDPAEYLDKYADRVPFIHLKDVKQVGSSETCVCGEGIVDFKAVIHKKNRTLVLEQEPIKDQWLDVEKSLKYLKSL